MSIWTKFRASRYFEPAIPIALLLTVLVFALAGSPKSHAPESQQEAASAQHSAQAPPRPSDEQPNASSPQNGAEHSGPDWEQGVAIGTWLLFFATVALFVATYALFRTAAKDGERALNQARELFAAERRPWIEVTVLKTGDPTELEDAISLPISFRMKNIGLSPAVAVEVVCHTTRQRSEGMDLEEFEKEMGFFRRHISKSVPGGFLFPNASVLNPHVVQDIKIKNASGEYETKFYIRAWAQYRFAGAPKEDMHFTPVFAWIEITRDPTSHKIVKVQIGPCGVDLAPD